MATINTTYKIVVSIGIAFGLLFTAVFFKPELERLMSLHMLVHIPMIITAGVFTAYGLHIGLAKSERVFGDVSFNKQGITGFVFTSLVGVYWMIPKALDHVLVSPYAAIGKFISVCLAGFFLYWSWRRAHTVVKVFFLGFFCWMLAMVGLLYQETTQRLCNFYLINDQEWSGIGLVILSIALPLTWLVTEVLEYRRIK